MFLYIDESGGHKYPLDQNTDPFFSFAILRIESQDTRKKIGALQRSILFAYKSIRRTKRFLREVKGKQLVRYPGLWIEFFRQLRRVSNFHVYLLLVDLRALRQKLPEGPENDEKRYALILRNILTRVRIPPRLRFFPVIVDEREREKLERLRFKLIVRSTLMRTRKDKRTYFWTFENSSSNDWCLQTVDIFAHFAHRKLWLDSNPPDPLLDKKRQYWEVAYNEIKDKVSIRRPLYLETKLKRRKS